MQPGKWPAGHPPDPKASGSASFKDGGTGGSAPGVSAPAATNLKNYLWKVYLIVLIQLAVIDLCIFFTTSRLFTRELETAHPIVLLVSGILVLVIWIVMYVFNDSLGRFWPVNLLLLALFTLASAYLLTALASEYRSPQILDTVMLLSFVVLLQLLYAIAPCCGFSFLISNLIALGAIAILATMLIASDPKSFTFQWQVDWNWIVPTTNNQRDAAMSAVGVWLTLLVALAFAWIFQYNLWCLANGPKVRTEQHVQGAFEVYVSMLLMFAFAIQAAGWAVKGLTSCACFRTSPTSIFSRIRG